MPQGDYFAANDIELRALLYGPAKSKKTWWALRAAEFGFRVLVFDMDRGASIIQQIPEWARKNIYVLEINDGPLDAFAARFVVSALRNYEFWFDEESRQVSHVKRGGLRHCNMRDFGRDTFVVFDSYTALATSVARQYAFENNIDLADAEKPEWEGFRWCGQLLTWILTQMRGMPCNVVTIGHETQYEKYKKDPANPKRQGPLEFTRRQLVSSSNPHGMGIPQYFTDIFYMYAEGRNFYLDCRGNRNEDAGSRHVAPERYVWDDFTIADLAAAANVFPPEKVAPFDFPVEEQLAVGGGARSPVQNNANTQTAASANQNQQSRQPIKPRQSRGTLLIHK